MEVEPVKKQLLEYLKEIDVWEGWKDNYNKFIPKFIAEATEGKNWDEWDADLFYEFFERSNNQCVSSLRQGYFTKEEQKAIKENWMRIAPVLQKIALNQDVPQFETYNELKDILRDYTRVDRRASTYRLIASLQPKILCTIVNHAKLNELITYLNKFVSGSQISFSYNWFESSNHVLTFFVEESEYTYKDIITYPWQLLEHFKGNHHIEDNDMSEDAESKLKTEINLLQYKKQIILQGPPGTGKTKLAKELADVLIKSNNLEDKTVSIKALTKEDIISNLKVGQKIKAKNDIQFEVLSLEKNGVVLKSDTSKPWKPSYNKIIDSFNNKYWQVKGRTGGFRPYEDAIAKYFYEHHLENISSTDEKVYQETDYLSITQFHPSYTYEDFVRGIVSKPNEEGDGVVYEAENKTLAKFADLAVNDAENKYVLIIDEINRANLSSVLGELIYALEYRGEDVESMYQVGDSNKISLPPNLYIIGTMNTADRSVGHIDYAIRRRFAFVDVLPKNLNEEIGVIFDQELFHKVTALFVKDYDPNIDYSIERDKLKASTHLSEEFRPEDVWLGHSYFIDKSNEPDGAGMDVRLEYEIKPILLEYIRDGVLKETARAIIHALPNNIIESN